MDFIDGSSVSNNSIKFSLSGDCQALDVDNSLTLEQKNKVFSLSNKPDIHSRFLSYLSFNEAIWTEINKKFCDDKSTSLPEVLTLNFSLSIGHER